MLWPRLSLLLRAEKMTLSRLLQLSQPNDVFAAKLNTQLHITKTSISDGYPQRPSDRRSSITDIRLNYLPGCRNYLAWSSSRHVWRSSRNLSRSSSSRRQRKTSGYRGGTGRSDWRRGKRCTTNRLCTSWHSYLSQLGRCLGLWCWRHSYYGSPVSHLLLLQEKCPVQH